MYIVVMAKNGRRVVTTTDVDVREITPELRERLSEQLHTDVTEFRFVACVPADRYVYYV